MLKSFFRQPLGNDLYSAYNAFFLARSSVFCLFASFFLSVASLHLGARRGFLIFLRLFSTRMYSGYLSLNSVITSFAISDVLSLEHSNPQV